MKLTHSICYFLYENAPIQPNAKESYWQNEFDGRLHVIEEIGKHRGKQVLTT